MIITAHHNKGQFKTTSLEANRLSVEIEGQRFDLMAMDDKLVITGDFAIVIEPRATNMVYISNRDKESE